LEKWCNDAVYFLRNNQKLIEAYPKQVQESALLFTPDNSLLYQSHFHKAQKASPTILNKPSIIQSTHRVLQSGLGKAGIRSCEFSPDGRRILTLGGSGILQLWDTTNGTMITTLHDFKSAPAHGSATFSKNGALIATGGNMAFRVVVWDGTTGKFIKPLMGEHQATVNNVIFSLNDEFIVSASEDLTIRRWPTVEEYRSKKFSGAAHSQSIYSLTASPDGTRIASRSKDSLILWNVENCSALQKWEERGGCAAPIFSLDGRKLIEGDESGKIHIYDTSTQETTRIIEAHQASVDDLAVCADRTTLASASIYEKVIRLWNIHTGEELCAPLSAHTDDILRLAFSKKGRRLVSTSCDHTIRVWNLWQDGKFILTDSFALVGHTDYVDPIAVTAEADRVVSSSSDGTIRLWDIHDSGDSSSFVETLERDRIETIHFSRDGKIIACGLKTGKLQLWDTEMGLTIGKCVARSDGPIIRCEFSNRNDILATGSEEGVAIVWRSSNDTYPFFELKRHPRRVTCVKFMKTDMTLAICGGDSVGIWRVNPDNLERSELMQNIDNLEGPEAVNFSSDEKYLLFSTFSGLLNVWSFDGDRLVSQVPAKRSGFREYISFSPDGETVAKAHNDGVDLYNFTPEAGLCLFASIQCSYPRKVAFSQYSDIIYVDTYYQFIADLPRDQFVTIYNCGKIKQGMSTPLPSFIYRKKWSDIIPLRERDSEELGNFLALPTSVNVERWEAFENQLALGLHDGSLMIVRIPYDYM
jgi:WD40 repeat protein